MKRIVILAVALAAASAPAFASERGDTLTPPPVSAIAMMQSADAIHVFQTTEYNAGQTLGLSPSPIHDAVMTDGTAHMQSLWPTSEMGDTLGVHT